MTRVNLVDPKLLIDEHLVAEYREIKRIANNPPKNNNIPSSYVLGQGHVTFFKDKLDYIRYRHNLITREMRRRGFNVNIELDKPHKKGFWMPKQHEVMVSVNRLVDRISTMKSEPHYYGNKIDRQVAIRQLMDGV